MRISGGHRNASIQQHDAPRAHWKMGKRKSEHQLGKYDKVMLEQKYAAANTFRQTGWRNRYTWSRGQSKTMIDFFLCPMHMLHWHYESRHRCGKWNMHSDHRTVHFRLPETTHQKR